MLKLRGDGMTIGGLIHDAMSWITGADYTCTRDRVCSFRYIGHIRNNKRLKSHGNKCEESKIFGNLNIKMFKITGSFTTIIS